MTREERRRQASEIYLAENVPDRYRKYFGHMKLAFEAGAEWSDNNPDLLSLWHDAKEMPNYGSAYIAIDNNNHICDCCDESLIISQTVWADIVSVRKIYKWIYIADILPKGGDK